MVEQNNQVLNGILSGKSNPKLRAQTFLSEVFKGDVDVMILPEVGAGNVLTEYGYRNLHFRYDETQGIPNIKQDSNFALGAHPNEGIRA